jgi:hypothetical protein
MSAPARAHIRETTHRLIASRFPPIGFHERGIFSIPQTLPLGADLPIGKFPAFHRAGDA